MTNKVRDELLALQEASADGLLHPAAVVAWARDNPKSALHGKFTWDDKKAAEAHRVWEARMLIQVNVVSADGTPKLVSLTIDRVNGGGYRSLDAVVKDRTLASIMLDDALRELERIEAKYERVEFLSHVWRALDEVRARREDEKNGGHGRTSAA